jgi:hypothetical protein
VVQFGLRVGPVKREIPSASLRAGSSLRLKNGSAQDDSLRVIAKLHHYRFLASMLYRAFPSLAVARQDASTAVELRVREAQSSLSMTGLQGPVPGLIIMQIIRRSAFFR